MQQDPLIPHLFRTEYRKITAVLCKLFGIEHLEAVEDIASDTFLAAVETWPYKGIPANPTAWLYTVAKNKARNYFQRDKVFRKKIVQNLKTVDETPEIDIDLSEKNIGDSQLQMLFAICHPSIPPEAQVGLALRILCGFGIEEIATAFLSNKETINKRLFRAKEKLRQEKVEIRFPEEKEISQRLDTVLTTLYLLFNEGYYSESQDGVLRKELCVEAMRLTYQLTEHNNTNIPSVNALLALMCFHTSRFKARLDANKELVLYDDQDERLWDQELIVRGIHFFKQASVGKQLSHYHLEAGIAYWYTIKEDRAEKWENILHLYNHLLQIAYSPIAALNRTYAFSKIHGKTAAFIEAKKLELSNNLFYFMLLGELCREENPVQAKHYYEQALALARTNTDQQTIRKQIGRLAPD